LWCDNIEAVNRFQTTALANLSFDLAKAMFAVAVVPQVEFLSTRGEIRWAFVVAGTIGGICFVMLGLYLGKGIKDK